MIYTSDAERITERKSKRASRTVKSSACYRSRSTFDLSGFFRVERGLNVHQKRLLGFDEGEEKTGHHHKESSGFLVVGVGQREAITTEKLRRRAREGSDTGR